MVLWMRPITRCGGRVLAIRRRLWRMGMATARWMRPIIFCGERIWVERGKVWDGRAERLFLRMPCRSRRQSYWGYLPCRRLFFSGDGGELDFSSIRTRSLDAACWLTSGRPGAKLKRSAVDDNRIHPGIRPRMRRSSQERSCTVVASRWWLFGLRGARAGDVSARYQPLLARRCFSCHGPNKHEGGSAAR